MCKEWGVRWMGEGCSRHRREVRKSREKLEYFVFTLQSCQRTNLTKKKINSLIQILYDNLIFQKYHYKLSDFFFLCKQHQEFSFLLKERVCPLVIKLFSPNIKFRQGSSTSSSPAPVEKPYFPICMRLLRVVSVLIKQFYSLLVSVHFWACFIYIACILVSDRIPQLRT